MPAARRAASALASSSPCRDMAASHKDLGIRMRDMNALVENLQTAMREEKIAFAAQNRFLSKLAPMSGDVIRR